MERRKLAALVSFFLVFFVVNILHWQKESIMDHGISVFVPLYPMDLPEKPQRFLPLKYRSFMPSTAILSETGKIVITVDPDTYHARFVRMHQPDLPLQPGEHLLSYRVRRSGGLTSHNTDTNLYFADDAFLIPQDETNMDYVHALFALLRVGKNGRAYLVGLADQDLRLLGRKPFDF